MTKSLVLGGSGYLGNELVRQLIKDGVAVVSVDKVEPQQKLLGVEYVTTDLSDSLSLSKIFEHNIFDKVFHFAGISSLDDAIESFTRTLQTNSLMTLEILQQVKKFRIPRFIFASSMYVFSDKGGTYRLSKQISEQIIEEFSKNFGINSSIIRFGSIYGPGSNSSNGLHRIIKASLFGNSIKYEGSANSMREYIHIRDAICACVRIAEQNIPNNQVFFLTGDRFMRIHDVLLMIKEILGTQKPIEYENREDHGHYNLTPFSYRPSAAVKYHLTYSEDFSHGLWELIDYVAKVENSAKANENL